VDHIVPVDIYLPGCPPRPEMLMDAILTLHEQVMDAKLGAHRTREIAELEAVALSTPATSEMRGLLR
jgi:NADH-quinone oxidoreductase subunit B